MTHIRTLGALVCSLFLVSAAQAAEPVAPASTDWRGPATFKGKLVSGGANPGPVELSVDFGPNGGLALAAGEFRVTADDGIASFVVEGTFGVDAKGQPVLTPDAPALAVELKALLVHICEDVLMLGTGCDYVASLDVEVDPAKLQLKAKTNSGGGDGATLALAAKLPFMLSDSTRVSFSIKTDPTAELVK